MALPPTWFQSWRYPPQYLPPFPIGESHFAAAPAWSSAGLSANCIKSSLCETEVRGAGASSHLVYFGDSTTPNEYSGCLLWDRQTGIGVGGNYYWHGCLQLLNYEREFKIARLCPPSLPGWSALIWAGQIMTTPAGSALLGPHVVRKASIAETQLPYWV